MAYLETSATNVQDLIKKLETFCKNNLNWHIAGGGVFQPKANSDTYTISNVYTTYKNDKLVAEKMTPTYLNNMSGFDISSKFVNDLRVSQAQAPEKCGCNLLIGFGRVWFTGDENGVFCVIEIEKANFRWFGFGGIQTNNPSKPISWIVGSYMYGRVIYNSKDHGADSMYGMDGGTTLFGTDGKSHQNQYEGVNFNDGYYSHLLYNDEVYRDKDGGLTLRGGYLSQHYNYMLTLTKSTITNNIILSELPLIISRGTNLKNQIVSKIPYIYCVNIDEMNVPKEVTFGGKRYMCFAVHSKGQIYYKAPRGDGDKYRVFTGDACGFAICMDD